MKSFADFDLAPDVLAVLKGMGIETPTPIQENCIPFILAGKDVVGKAETGTGKTIGFGAPLVGMIDTNRVSVQALVLTPTRELAQQVAGVIEQLAAGRQLGVALVVGGVHASEQVLKLRSGTQVVVGTPGRVLDFLRERIISLVWCHIVVLDEADRMLDMGFIDDVTAILEKTPSERQTLLFSATIPNEIRNILKRYMKEPEIVSTSQGLSTVPEIVQTYVETDFRNKFRELQKILDARKEETILIFCNTRRQAIDLDRMLWGHGYSAGSLHGEQEQDVRFRILESFRKGEIKTLVATDVASRGLDIEAVGCVVNYEIPGDPESYVHRIGRTGRAQRAGAAISMVSSREWGDWQRILKETGFKIERVGPARLGGRRGGGEERRDEGRRGGAGWGERRRDERGQREHGDARGEGRRRRRRGGRGRGRRPQEGEGGQGREERVYAGAPARGAPPPGEGLAPEAARSAEDAEFEPVASSEPAGFPPEEPVAAGSEGGAQLLRWGDPDRRKQPAPERRKLEDVGEDFFRTQYFDVDDSLVKRGGDARPQGRGERRGGGGGERRGGRGGAERGPHGRPPGVGAPRPAPAGVEASGAPGAGATQDGGGRGRRRRRRRRRGGRGGEGGRSGGGAPPQ